jgi:hypothetical protein
MMKAKFLIAGAFALAFAPGIASAAPPTTSNGAAHSGDPVAAGQPSQDCVDLVNDPSGSFSFPGHSSTSPGSAFNEDPGGVAGSVYAGEQTQNTINAATSSQYDVACLHNQSHQ